MAKSNPTLQYRIYLLTIWRYPPASGSNTWRFRLQDPHTDKQWGFTRAGELLAILQSEWRQDNGSGEED